MQLRALKTFSNGGSKLIYVGETFTANEKDGNELIRLSLAESTESTTTMAATASPTPEPQGTHPTEEELKQKNLTELRKIAKDMGVSGYSTMNKADLITAILNG